MQPRQSKYFKLFIFLQIYIGGLSCCLTQSVSRAHLHRLSGARPELAQDIRNLDEANLKRISKLPPMTQLKVNFCNKLLGGKSSIIHRLGDVVNCKEVYEKYGNERKYKVKKPKDKRKKFRPVRPEVSNFVEDGPIVIEDYHLTTPEEETEYFYEDIVDDEGSEGSWRPQEDTFAPGKNFEAGTYYVTDDLVEQSPPPTPAPILQPQHNLGFQYEISHPKSSSQPAAKLPITKSTQDHFNSNPGIPGPAHSQPQQVPPFDGGDVFMRIPTNSASPGSVHWEPSSYDSNPSVGEVGTTTVKTTTAFNTINWPSHTWGSSDQGVKSWPSTTQSPALNKNFKTNNNKKIISWQANTWTTTARPATTTPSPGEYWATSGPQRELTSKSVLAAPSHPTKPLGETATFSSNPRPSQFSSDLLGNVGHSQKVKMTREQDTVPVPIKKRDEILQKNYFFTPSPTPLHLRTGINKIPNFESEFTAFGSEAHKSTFSSFDTNFDDPTFGGAGGGARLKKEVKSSDVTLAGEENTYYHYGQPDSSARASGEPATAVLREEHKKDIVQLYIPDPLAPGHPKGNGNHGWAPIEEWAKAQMRENLDSPSWADSQIPPANSVTGGDWSDKTRPKSGQTVKARTPAWSSPTPATFHTGSPSLRSYRRSTTVRPEAVTVSQADVSTMRYPGPSPVTPMYSTNFGDYASLNVEHMAGPTGSPGLALFNTVVPRQPHSNSHYMEQNPFIVSPVTPLSVTAATAAAMRRNIDPADYWSYNPVTEASSVKTYSPLPRNTISSQEGKEDSPVTGFSYKNVDWPKTGVSAGYENFHY